MRPTLPMLALCGAVFASPPLAAAEPPTAPPDDLDALSLADKAPAAPAATAQRWRAFGEVGAGRNGQRALFGAPAADGNTARLSLDFRFDDKLAPAWRAVLSDRLDLLHASGEGGTELNTLREAYLSWAAADDTVLDIGRVNIRHGSAWGYNPTDFFKENALRSVISPDPAQLRENRQGTFVLQGQRLWGNAALSAAYSPKLASPRAAPDRSTFTFDAGATNPRHRWLLAGSLKLGERFNPELLAYGGTDTPTQFGANLSTVLGEATVLFGEFSAGRGRSLLAQTLAPAYGERDLRRAAIGATYTTAFNLSLTAEAEYSGAGATAAQWRSLPAADPGAPLRLLAASQALQELPARRAAFFYASWKDAGVRRLDLSAFLRHELETHSRHQWLEARWRFDRADLSLQLQWFSGADGSIFGSVPQRRAAELVLRAYL